MGLLFYQKYMCVCVRVNACVGKKKKQLWILFQAGLSHKDCSAFIMLLRYLIYFLGGTEVGRRFVGLNAQFRFNWASNCHPSE